jgi:hypothetical protein
MEKIKWLEKVTNEVIKQKGENMLLLNNIIGRKVNWIRHIPFLPCFFHFAEAILSPLGGENNSFNF